MSALDPLDLARRLTLAGLVLQPIATGGPRALALALAVAGLVFPALSRSAWLWLALVGVTGWRVIASWPLADNHAYLLVYWCLAIAIASRDKSPRETLAWNGRVLLGLVFSLALLWKALSPDYLDGRFFRVTLVTDERLAPFARIAGGLGADALAERREFLGRHVDGPAAETAPPAAESARFRCVARLAALSSFAFEALLALAFLWPLGRGPSRIRDPLLIAFCASTYLIAPVRGFGWLLVALGVSQSDPSRAGYRAGYLAAFALVWLYGELSWAWLA